jgi:UDP-N-acetylmuramoylalanine--D-glutamate ligase
MKALVVGMGKSGKSAVKLLEKKGYKVFTYDDKNPSKVPENPDIVVKSPGVPREHPLISRFLKKGVKVVGEVELAYTFAKGTIVAITGTNGKSTTTAVVYHTLKHAGYKVFVGGNYGIPFSSFAEETDQDCVVVLELSSFQIEDLVSFHCNTCAVLNITPDHLERHRTFSAYAQAKLKLLDFSDTKVLNYDDAVLRKVKCSNALFFSLHTQAHAYTKAGTIYCADVKVKVDELPLKGLHNTANYMASILILKSLGVEPEDIVRGLKTFKGLPHRTEPAGMVNGIPFVNDSKSTNPGSLESSLLSFNRVVLIAGGKDKGLDFSYLKKTVRERVKAIVAIGETAQTLYSTFKEVVPVCVEEDIYSAVKRAYALAEKGDTVLFSPGCSSFDRFKNFEHRGEVFKEAVKRLGEEVEKG